MQILLLQKCILYEVFIERDGRWSERIIERIKHNKKKGGARGVVVIVVGNRHGDTSSNPGPG